MENAHAAKEKTEETNDVVKPIVQEPSHSHSQAQQTNATASSSSLSLEDEAYVKRLLARPDVHKSLVVYRHYPFRISELLEALEKYNFRAYEVLFVVSE